MTAVRNCEAQRYSRNIGPYTFLSRALLRSARDFSRGSYASLSSKRSFFQPGLPVSRFHGVPIANRKRQNRSLKGIAKKGDLSSLSLERRVVGAFDAY